MTNNKSVAAELLANTPAALPLDQALANIQRRRAAFIASCTQRTPLEPDLTLREPMPVVEDPDAFAAGFWERFKPKEPPSTPPPPRGSKPTLVAHAIGMTIISAMENATMRSMTVLPPLRWDQNSSLSCKLLGRCRQPRPEHGRFALCRLLGFQLLPRLEAMRKQLYYRPAGWERSPVTAKDRLPTP